MKKILKAGATSQTIDIWVGNSSSTTGAGLTGLVYNSAGLTCYYRVGATGNATALSLANQTAYGAWTQGGFAEISSTNMPGIYRLDLANATVASAGSASLSLKGATNMAPVNIELQMVTNDFEAGVVSSVTGGVGGNITGAVLGGMTGNITGNLSGSVGSVAGNVTGAVLGGVTGNITGNITGSVASVTGSVGSVTGNIGGNLEGNVVGSVGSVLGNVGGNLVGDVGGNVTGTVASVIGNVGGNLEGNVAGSVASVTGNVGGNVNGSVGSVIGDVSGSVTGSVGSVVGNVGGNVNGSVGTVTGNVDGNVFGFVGSVAGNITGNLTGSIGSLSSDAMANVTEAANSTIVGYHLDHLLATAYDASAKPGASDSLLNTLVGDSGNGTPLFTELSLSLAPSGGGGNGTTDWTANERTAIRSILGIPASGTTPDDPTVGILDTIRDGIGNANTTLHTAIADVPTNSELNARTLLAADYANATNLAAANSTLHAAIVPLATGTALDGVQDVILDTFAAQNNISTAEVANEMAIALSDIHLDKLLAAAYDSTNPPGAIGSLFNSIIEDDSGVPRFTTNSLEQAPSGGNVSLGNGSSLTAILEAIADVPTTSEFEARTLLAANYATAANLAAANTSIASANTTLHAAIADTPTTSEFEARTLAAASYATAANLTLANTTLHSAIAAIPDTVWDEATSGHATAGTTGKALADAGSAGDPWETSIGNGSTYSEGQAGQLLSKLRTEVANSTVIVLPNDPVSDDLCHLYGQIVLPSGRLASAISLKLELSSTIPIKLDSGRPVASREVIARTDTDGYIISTAANGTIVQYQPIARTDKLSVGNASWSITSDALLFAQETFYANTTSLDVATLI